MELTTGQQRLLFVVVVLALAGLGFYLVTSRGGSGGSPGAAPSSASTVVPASTSQPAASGAAAGVPPSTVPAATPASTVGGAEIYQWLPFSAADLAAAAKTTVTFAGDYATWSYTEDAAAYGAKLSGLVTAQEAATLQDDYGTPGVAGPRAADKQVSTGSGTIDSISSFGSGNPTSITFLVTISQQVSSTQPAKSMTGQYTVTVISSGNDWQVNDIELSGIGNT
jgi:hypothetical protein